MDKQQIMKILKKCSRSPDKELAQFVAEAKLMEYLRSQGDGDIVDEYNKLNVNKENP